MVQNLSCNSINWSENSSCSYLAVITFLFSPCRHWSLCSHVSKHIQDIPSSNDPDHHTDCNVCHCISHDLQPLPLFLWALTFQQHASVHVENHDHDHRRDGIWRHFSPLIRGVRQHHSTNTISKNLLHTVDHLSYSHAHPLHQLAGKQTARCHTLIDLDCITASFMAIMQDWITRTTVIHTGWSGSGWH